MITLVAYIKQDAPKKDFSELEIYSNYSTYRAGFGYSKTDHVFTNVSK